MKTVCDVRPTLSPLSSRRTPVCSLHSVLPSAPSAFIGFAGLWSHTHSLRTS